MDTKEEFDDEQMFKKIEQHNRNVNVVVSLTIIATMLIGVMAIRMYLMQAHAQEAKSKIEIEFEEDVKRFKKEIAVSRQTALSSETKQMAEAKDSSKNTNWAGIKPAPTKCDSHKSNYKATVGSPGSSAFNHQSSTKKSKYADLHVDINTADTAELRKLPGIGEKRALNIVKYRTSLGGFYTVEQLAEVYCMDADLVERLKKYIFCDGKSIVKVDINNVNPYKLWHPYLKGELLTTIKQRLKAGKRYKSFEEIKAEIGYDENMNGRSKLYLEFK